MKRAASGLRSLPSTKPLSRQNGLSGQSSSLSAPSHFGTPIPHSEILKPIDQFLTASGFNLSELCRGVHGKLADIETADGDLAFFLEQNGFSVDAIDFEPTNFNQMEGIRILKKALNSTVTIHSVDLDSQFFLPSEKYDTIFLLGILYHLFFSEFSIT